MKPLFLNPVKMEMGIYICMPQVKNQKARNYISKGIIKQENGIELTFTLELNMQKKHFSEEDQQFFSKWNVHYQPLLGWESTCICHKLKSGKQVLFGK